MAGVLVVLLAAAATLPLSSSGWVDPDSQTLETESLSTGAPLQLVYSDEFEVAGWVVPLHAPRPVMTCCTNFHRRSFADGNDPRWTAIDKNDYTNDAMQYYNSSYATTSGGCLNISTVIQDVSFKVNSGGRPQKATKTFQSAMLQGWNKFCFVGGAIEISAKLPGREDVGGLW